MLICTNAIMNKTFLKRNLKNMRDQRRKSQPRKNLTLLEWISKLGAQNKRCCSGNIVGDYVSLKFLGVFGSNLTSREVEVRPNLLKIVYNKRKQNRRTVQEMCDTVVVKINPDDSSNEGNLPAISIPTDKTGRPNESVHVQLMVTVLKKSLSRPLSKRMKLDNVKYELELVVVDKFQRKLSNGEYEAQLQLAKDSPGFHVVSNMEISKGNNNSCDIQKLPKLKFYLEWTRHKVGGLADRPATICMNESNHEILPDRNCSGSLQCEPSGLRSLAYLSAFPVRRTVATEMIFCRPNRLKRKLPEFIQIDEFVDDEPFITGDNTFGDQYQPHVQSNGIDAKPEDENIIPLVSPNEVDIDLEDENMPFWLEVNTKTMIDKLACLNEGEKALMKMWNIHIMKHRYYATDGNLRVACKSFIEQNGRKILEIKLYNNFVTHMVNLCGRRIISLSFFKDCIERLQELARDNNIEL